jgi:poly(3-hydroxybutyrate) depolymerase
MSIRSGGGDWPNAANVVTLETDIATKTNADSRRMYLAGWSGMMQKET